MFCWKGLDTKDMKKVIDDNLSQSYNNEDLMQKEKGYA